MDALIITLLIVLVPNLALATVVLWMHTSTDARLTLRGHRYVSFVFGIVIVGLFISAMGVAGWVETMP